MSVLRDLLAANGRYADGFSGSELPATPRLALAILTCMDARIVPHRLLGLEEGDAHVIRNAGGRASGDALRSLILSSRLLGTREILIIQHTRCGIMGLDQEGLRRDLQRDTGVDASDLDFLSFDDLEESVRCDVERVRSSPFIVRDASVHGFVYDVVSGRLEEVV